MCFFKKWLSMCKNVFLCAFLWARMRGFKKEKCSEFRGKCTRLGSNPDDMFEDNNDLKQPIKDDNYTNDSEEEDIWFNEDNW